MGTDRRKTRRRSARPPARAIHGDVRRREG